MRLFGWIGWREGSVRTRTRTRTRRGWAEESRWRTEKDGVNITFHRAGAFANLFYSLSLSSRYIIAQITSSLFVQTHRNLYNDDDFTTKKTTSNQSRGPSPSFAIFRRLRRRRQHLPFVLRRPPSVNLLASPTHPHSHLAHVHSIPHSSPQFSPLPYLISRIYARPQQLTAPSSWSFGSIPVYETQRVIRNSQSTKLRESESEARGLGWNMDGIVL